MKIKANLKKAALVFVLFLLPVQAVANPLLFNEVGIVTPKISKPAPDFKLKNIQGNIT